MLNKYKEIEPCIPLQLMEFVYVKPVAIRMVNHGCYNLFKPNEISRNITESNLVMTTVYQKDLMKIIIFVELKCI